MENLLSAFSFTVGQWQDIKALLLHLKQNKRETNELIDYIDKLQIIRKKPQKVLKQNFKRITKLCPECRTIMRLLSVNVNKATQTGDDSSSVWICQNKECMHTEYSTKTVQEIMKELIKKK